MSEETAKNGNMVTGIEEFLTCLIIVSVSTVSPSQPHLCIYDACRLFTINLFMLYIYKPFYALKVLHLCRGSDKCKS